MSKSTQHLKKNDFYKVQLRERQRQYQDKIINNTITIATGPAGTSKSFSAIYTALLLYSQKKIDKIIFTKPIQEAGENLGFLPGDKHDKIEPYFESFIQIAKKIINQQALDFLLDTETIEFKPLAYIRSSTFDNTFMILDEAQNCTIKQLMLFTTRLGKNSKMVINGDINQYDIKKKDLALPIFTDLLRGIKDITEHTFETNDIVRAKILKDIVKKYEKWKHDNDI